MIFNYILQLADVLTWCLVKIKIKENDLLWRIYLPRIDLLVFLKKIISFTYIFFYKILSFFFLFFYKTVLSLVFAKKRNSIHI